MANEMIIGPTRAYPENFRVLLTLPLQFPDVAVDVLDRFANEPSVVGAALMGTAGGRPRNETEFLTV